MIKKLVRAAANRLLKISGPSAPPPSIPLTGYTDNLQSIPRIEQLSDEDLNDLNTILKWNAFVADSKGRRFGDKAWSGKRDIAQQVPDYRHVLLNERVPLRSRSVLEIGCFEGIHTISLCRLASKVIAVDSRMENIVKTLVRCGMFGESPTVFKCDVERWDTPLDWMKADVCHHVGVLYHLKDPVAHLVKLSTVIKDAILLDTHIAIPGDQLTEYQSGEKKYRYRFYGEGGKQDVFAGMYDHAKWLLLDDLKGVLSDCGFRKVEVLEERSERNGPRVLLLAQK